MPLRTSTKPGVRTPSSTRRRTALSFSTTHMALLPCMGRTASSGTTTAFSRTAAISSPSANMPGWSSPRGFDTTALMRMVRPGWRMTGSTKSTVPTQVRSRSAATRNETRRPVCRPSAYRSGTSSATRMGLTVCSETSRVCEFT